VCFCNQNKSIAFRQERLVGSTSGVRSPEPPALMLAKPRRRIPEVDDGMLELASGGWNSLLDFPFTPSIWLCALIWFSPRGSGGSHHSFATDQTFLRNVLIAQMWIVTVQMPDSPKKIPAPNERGRDLAFGCFCAVSYPNIMLFRINHH
jgi:hypothetical protein